MDEKKKGPEEADDAALDGVTGGVGMLLPGDLKADGSRAEGGINLVLGDGSVRFVRNDANKGQTS